MKKLQNHLFYALVVTGILFFLTFLECFQMQVSSTKAIAAIFFGLLLIYALAERVKPKETFTYGENL